MISPMTKYSFILLSGQTEEFLSKIQDLGVIDITRSVKPVDEKSEALLSEADTVKKALAVLNSCDAEPEKGFRFDGDPVEAALKAQADVEELKNELSSAKKELSARKPWGQFSTEAIGRLEAQGLKICFYSCQKKKFDPAWAEIQPLQVVSETDTTVFFVTVAPVSEEYSFPIEPIAAPEGSVNEMELTIKDLETKLSERKKLLGNLKGCIGELRQRYNEKLGALDLYLAESATEMAADSHLAVVTGFAPTEDDKRLCDAFDALGIYYIHELATKEDNPPIKLHNNWFAKNFEVLTGMYGMPVYDEFDPTPVLGPFFMLFFAMCMGDAGYGIVLMLIALFMKLKMQGTSLGKMYRLIGFLGGMTFFVGLFLGTFFGMSILEASWTPEWLKALCVDGWFPDGKIAGFPVQMVLAVAIGVLHICLAMIIKTINYTKRFGFSKTVSTWGWTTLIVGGIIVIALGMTEVLSEVAFKWVIIALAAVSSLAIFVFNTPGRNPLVNIGSGLWDTYNMVTGLMGDVLSYIRLYALGLAGGMLGNAFNIMGTMILDIPVPGVNWVFCIVILIFGHVLNLAMSCLGAFVHPLRLTFVEYFKNSGYEGTGLKYNPLTKTK
ncbi:MAG: V-type ATPase 116kDa subunit family protein [Bacteroidales bacterium]|nr:V-type ATPase 116kDa subunit family protein [Bacteroidales bacterium]